MLEVTPLVSSGAFVQQPHGSSPVCNNEQVKTWGRCPDALADVLEVMRGAQSSMLELFVALDNMEEQDLDDARWASLEWELPVRREILFHQLRAWELSSQIVAEDSRQAERKARREARCDFLRAHREKFLAKRCELNRLEASAADVLATQSSSSSEDNAISEVYTVPPITVTERPRGADSLEEAKPVSDDHEDAWQKCLRVQEEEHEQATDAALRKVSLLDK